MTLDLLITDVKKLIEIEDAHPNLLSDPLLHYIKGWLLLDEVSKKTAIPALLSAFIDGQDCDYMGTQWEKGSIADGKVCHCIACVTARKCISYIKQM